MFGSRAVWSEKIGFQKELLHEAAREQFGLLLLFSDPECSLFAQIVKVFEN